MLFAGVGNADPVDCLGISIGDVFSTEADAGWEGLFGVWGCWNAILSGNSAALCGGGDIGYDLCEFEFEEVDI